MEEIISRFEKIRSWKRNGVRAPHKPLLILLAIGEYLNKREKLNYTEVAPKLYKLLAEFGPPRKTIHPEYPFLKLANDEGIWQVWNANVLSTKKEPSDSDLTKYNISAGFHPDLLHFFRHSPKGLLEVVEYLLEYNFPQSLHDDLLDAVGIKIERRLVKRRDPEFRDRVLSFYGYECAICGYNIKLGDVPIGLEAAHIKWHTAGGPDSVENGIALCTLHHRLFDKGAFTIRENKILVSPLANGENGYQEWLGNFNDRPLILPKKKFYISKEFVNWHFEEVFKQYY